MSGIDDPRLNKPTTQTHSALGGLGVIASESRAAPHTPGPWAVNWAGVSHGGKMVYDEVYVYAPASSSIAIAADIADPLTNEPSEANARLIAAAPDLLGLLKKARDFAESVHDGEYGYSDCTRDELIQTIDAAIARATGGTQ